MRAVDLAVWVADRPAWNELLTVPDDATPADIEARAAERAAGLVSWEWSEVEDMTDGGPF